MPKCSVNLRTNLLGGLSIAALIAAPAFAQTNSTADSSTTDNSTSKYSAAGMQTAGSSESVVVHGQTHHRPGGGLMAESKDVKVVQVTSREYILTQPATTNPIRLLSLQPGAVISSPDPYGIQPGSISVRGLNNNELGWIFEGAPLNDGQLYPNEVVDAPNLEQVSLVPGSTDFDLPSSGAAGGAVQILMHDPSHNRGGQIDFTYGSHDTTDAYIRYDTGDLANTGLRSFLSYSHVGGHDWRSPGTSTRTHSDFKMIKDWNGDSQTDLAVAYNDINFQVERTPTLAQWKQYGDSFNYDANFTKGDTNYYKLHQNPYRNVYATMPSTIKVGSDLTIYTDPYLYDGIGIIPGGTATSAKAFDGTQQITPSPINGGAAGLLYSATIPVLVRGGVNSNVRWHVNDQHTITAGYWFEYNERHTYAQFSTVSASGNPSSIWDTSNVVTLPNGAAYRYVDYLVRAQTNDFYVGDRMRFMDDKLAIDVGIKNIIFRQNAYNRIPGATYNINNNQFEPMPSLGARYDLDSKQQLFFDAGKNSKMPDASQLIDAYSSTSGALTAKGNNKQKPEISIVEELGYRYTGDTLVGSVAAFNYNFSHRQITSTVLQNSSLITTYLDGGSQTSRGVDVSFGTHPIYHFRPFISGEYLRATIDSDISRGGDYLPTKGKTATGAPSVTGALGLNYDDGHLFGMLQARYVGPQYSTFMNDEKMPGYATADLNVGYRFHDYSYMKHPQIALNFVNLTDNHYLTGMNSTTFNAVTTKGINGTSIAGSSPTYLVGGGFSMMVTVSAGF